MATLPDNRLKLRAMEPSDVAAIHAMSQGEQWPHRKQDITAMLNLGQGVVAEMGGEIMGSAMWWIYGEKVATLGMLLVDRRFRGNGIGRLIMESVLDQIGDRSILSIASDSGLSLLRKLGFRGVSEIRQHQGTAFTAPLVPLKPGERIRPMGANDVTDVSALVEAATGLVRPKMMKALLGKGHGIVLVHDEEIIGFAIFRRFGRGYVVGPVIAPDIVRAKALISQWLGSRSGEFIRLDMMGECGLHDWLEQLGLIHINSFVVMVRGEEPVPSQPGQSFAIVSQALF